ncbi:hypothetical protein GJ496_005135 [Pomphorhynchus laevis]|nr:hypothetical protein GJ496_005135 [Pomphorhynchus laevis]
MKSVRSYLSKNLDYYKIVFSDGIILSKKERNVLTMALNFMMSPPVIDRISVNTALYRLSNDVFQDEKEEAKLEEYISSFRHAVWSKYIKTNSRHTYQPNLTKYRKCRLTNLT